ncbi:MAG: EamA family transporter, partial [Clostridia bacterium]|nr:EamA family transporter [Clostridia bacterium]
ITFAAFPLFMTILEPLVLKVRLTLMNILTAIMILIGVFITVPFSSVEGNIMAGALIGLCSSAAYAVLTLINKGLSAQNSATKVSFYEQATAAVILLPIALMQKTVIRPMDMGLLVVFGIITTALAHTLFVSGLKYIPAHLAGVFSSLETVYSILFAFLILGEVPSLREVVGAFIIIAATMIASYAESRKRTV